MRHRRRSLSIETKTAWTWEHRVSTKELVECHRVLYETLKGIVPTLGRNQTVIGYYDQESNEHVLRGDGRRPFVLPVPGRTVMLRQAQS